MAVQCPRRITVPKLSVPRQHSRVGGQIYNISHAQAAADAVIPFGRPISLRDNLVGSFAVDTNFSKESGSGGDY